MRGALTRSCRCPIAALQNNVLKSRLLMIIDDDDTTSTGKKKARAQGEAFKRVQDEQWVGSLKQGFDDNTYQVRQEILYIICDD